MEMCSNPSGTARRSHLHPGRHSTIKSRKISTHPPATSFRRQSAGKVDLPDDDTIAFGLSVILETAPSSARHLFGNLPHEATAVPLLTTRLFRRIFKTGHEYCRQVVQLNAGQDRLIVHRRRRYSVTSLILHWDVFQPHTVLDGFFARVRMKPSIGEYLPCRQQRAAYALPPHILACEANVPIVEY